jgi:hypothetical protein
MAETATPTGPVDPKDLELFSKLAANPQDVISGQFRGYLEDFIRITMGTQKNWSLPVGSPLLIMKDLTAQTGEYVYTDEQGIQYLYCNGAAVSQTTYAGLYAHVGANAFAADSGGNFTLPDARGRSLFFCGTHTNADLGDNDGATEANRQAKHAHTNGVTGSITGSPSLSGAPSAGTLAVNPASHSHAAASGSFVVTGGASGVAAGANLDSVANTATTALAISGAPGIGSLAASAGSLGVSVGGTVGTGTAGDAPGHLFIGSLLVRF